LKRVIVAYQNQVVMEETLGAGLTRLFGGSGFDERPAIIAVAATDAAGESAAITSEDRVADVARRMSEHYDAAIAAQRVGDWATYGVEMRLVGELVQQLQNLVGS
jgi:hypothetical protein